VGCDGIVVSNHAGRQVDGAIASLDALENIIDAGIGEKIAVTFDSGVRGASDVIKALCIGAKFVWIGRLWVWGLSIMGEQGVRHVMRSLLAEFDIAMAVGGFKNIGEMKRDRLGKFPTQQRAYRRIAPDFFYRVVPKRIHIDRGEVEDLSARLILLPDTIFTRHSRHSHRFKKNNPLALTLCNFRIPSIASDVRP
jgi:FMN-dependent dehydrogenase